MFLLSEVLAQYTAYKVLEGRYPETMVNDYARFERDRYLAGRGVETLEEVPLLRTNHETWYLNYAKGFLVMRALDRYLGTPRLSQALADTVASYGSQDLLDRLRRVTPADLQYLLTDQLETITFHDLRLASATWRRTEDGGYALEVAYKAVKQRADGAGHLTTVPTDDLLPVRAWDAAGRVVYDGWQRVTNAEGRLTISTSAEPARVALDPDRWLIDLTPEGNAVAVRPAARP
jgi:ABC-2 type transport system permease protein